MTSYRLSIGYNGASRCDDDEMIRILHKKTKSICSDPGQIITEVIAFEGENSINLDSLRDYCKVYSDDIGSYGHPIKIVDGGVVQWASTSPDSLKYMVRRAFVRLLLNAMHSEGIEVNLQVS